MAIILWVVFGTCIVILSKGTSFKDSISAYPMTIVLIIICFGFSIFVLGMLGLHTYFSLANVTTYEFLKNQWNNITGNPFMK
jgi:hypothetical protein